MIDAPPQPLTFTIAGRPRAKERPRWDRRHHRMFTPDSTREYERTVHLIAGAARNAWPWGAWPRQARYAVEAVAYFRGDNRPDLDNVMKALLDGCTGALWDDDKRVVQHLIRAEECRSPIGQRLEVTVRILPGPAQGEL